MGNSYSALLVVDVQNDFCQEGSLSVPGGDKVVPILNEYMEKFDRAGIPIYVTRDWHPERTSHFEELGGQWPTHCVMGTWGAEFHPELRLPASAIIMSKGTSPEEDAYSAFHARDESEGHLTESLRLRGVRELYVGGLATDYCVRATVVDAIDDGYRVALLEDAVRGVEVQPGDSSRAMDEMVASGARLITLESIDNELAAPPRLEE